VPPHDLLPAAGRCDLSLLRHTSRERHRAKEYPPMCGNWISRRITPDLSRGKPVGKFAGAAFASPNTGANQNCQNEDQFQKMNDPPKSGVNVILQTNLRPGPKQLMITDDH
jgi:hypothetical protein